MDNQQHDQLELFSQTKGQAKARTSVGFKARISRYEKTILIIIGIAVMSIASFSFGVEKGKELSVSNTASKLDIAANPVPLPSITQAKQAIMENGPQAKEKEELPEQVQGYTIQVASFLNKTNAQKEVSTLKNKGMTAMVLSKGKFSIVCVGSFTGKKEAESFLPKLKKRYQDCLVRRL
ncbi:MAG: SPOR domain-containing protein [Candidatus Omnitrophota bacterium]